MSATIEREGESPSPELEQELHDLEAQEAALERRTRSLELSGPLALVLSFLALAIGIGALVVALGNRSDATTMMGGTNAGGQQTTGMMGSTSSGGMTMGAGGHGKFTPAMVSAAAHGKVYVQLGDYWAAPTVSSVRAG